MSGCKGRRRCKRSAKPCYQSGLFSQVTSRQDKEVWKYKDPKTNLGSDPCQGEVQIHFLTPRIKESFPKACPRFSCATHAAQGVLHCDLPRFLCNLWKFLQTLPLLLLSTEKTPVMSCALISSSLLLSAHSTGPVLRAGSHRGRAPPVLPCTAPLSRDFTGAAPTPCRGPGSRPGSPESPEHISPSTASRHSPHPGTFPSRKTIPHSQRHTAGWLHPAALELPAVK